ncbi:anti-anti-sigma factor [Nonomuraea solani]|uniref:Anti-sigma factor antagonist n=1 Tax=Nonomuraea solani TaxID=1144553 RepID=A0A1H6EPH8_9ACTN|nr:STAS domain-containing protein [Nonomuraea solani]SEG99747.1 anti-anti-sigma factor [Nonomuraea solani]
MSPLSLNHCPLPAGVLITVAGELDVTNAGHLESSIGGARRPGQPVVLDLGELTFMDSSGLHVLLRVHSGLHHEGATLHLAAVQDLPARILQITGVWDVLNIHADVAEATATLPLSADRRRLS